MLNILTTMSVAELTTHLLALPSPTVDLSKVGLKISAGPFLHAQTFPEWFANVIISF